MVKLTEFDAADYLDTPELQALFISEVIETGDLAYLKEALGVVARVQGINDTSALGALEDDPRLSTLSRALKALGLRLSVTPA